MNVLRDLVTYSVCARWRRVRAPRRLVRGQSMLEFALIVPVMILLGVGVFLVWLPYQRQDTLTNVSSTLADRIARTGAYTATMRDDALRDLNGAVAVGSQNSYLMIKVVAPDGTVTTIGTPVPAPGSPVTFTPPADTGWNDVNVVTNIPAGSQITVDIWRPYQVAVVGSAIVQQGYLDGHTVMARRGSP